MMMCFGSKRNRFGPDSWCDCDDVTAILYGRMLTRQNGHLVMNTLWVIIALLAAAFLANGIKRHIQRHFQNVRDRAAHDVLDSFGPDHERASIVSLARLAPRGFVCPFCGFSSCTIPSSQVSPPLSRLQVSRGHVAMGYYEKKKQEQQGLHFLRSADAERPRGNRPHG